MSKTQDLLLEVLERDGGEVEWFDLLDRASRILKIERRERNGVMYQRARNAIISLVASAAVSERYAPSSFDDDRLKLGKTYYRRSV